MSQAGAGDGADRVVVDHPERGWIDHVNGIGVAVRNVDAFREARQAGVDNA